jgi:soluble lytic murein transglycosylase-like protein
MNKQQVQKLIEDRVKVIGSPLPVAFFDRMCYIESRYNPNAVSSTNCKGLFQFSSGTWKTFGHGDRLNAQENTDAAIRLANFNFKGLKARTGKDPLPGMVYMAHNLGLGGAGGLVSADPRRTVTRAIIGSKPEYNPLYLMRNGKPITCGEAIQRYLNDFKGI